MTLETFATCSMILHCHAHQAVRICRIYFQQQAKIRYGASFLQGASKYAVELEAPWHFAQAIFSM